MSFAKKKMLVSLAAGTVLASGAAMAVDTDAYLLDTNKNVVKSAYGLCWRTGSWTPAKAIEECDPDLVKKVADAPPAAAPRPPQAEPAKILPQRINFSADA